MKSVVYKGVEYDCHIIDTAGQVYICSIQKFPPFFSTPDTCDYLCLTYLLHNQDEYTPINSQYAIGIHGYILVYSITSKNSFNLIQGVYDKIINFCGLPKIACVIVGSKSDLSMSYVTSGYPWSLFWPWPYLRRQVDSTDGEKLAKQNDCAWVETSAKNNVNISALYIPFMYLNAEKYPRQSIRTLFARDRED